MPLSVTLSAWLRELGHDAVHAVDLNLMRAPDVEILARARQESRTVITADLDYPRLLALTQAAAPGLILYRDGEWSEAEARERLAVVLNTLSEADIVRSVIAVERDRLRRRRLPLE